AFGQRRLVGSVARKIRDREHDRQQQRQRHENLDVGRHRLAALRRFSVRAFESCGSHDGGRARKRKGVVSTPQSSFRFGRDLHLPFFSASGLPSLSIGPTATMVSALGSRYFLATAWTSAGVTAATALRYVSRKSSPRPYRSAAWSSPAITDIVVNRNGRLPSRYFFASSTSCAV